MNCPFKHKVRSDIPPVPDCLSHLPVDERGYPVPFFVSWPNGKPEFRLADAMKQRMCIIQKLCWVCGKRLHGDRTFVVGPMCVVNLNSGEPPAHKECAEYSVKACPFITKPQMERREDEFTESVGKDPGGIMIKRNPGVTALYTCSFHKPYRDPNGRYLFEMGWPPVEVTWWRQGRLATRAEATESIESGIPLLEQHCFYPSDLILVRSYTARAMELLPAA